MQALLSNGCRMEYAEAGQGVPVVWLHAFPLAGSMWQSQVTSLQDRYRVIVPDLRGFGGTSLFEGAPSVEQMAEDIALLLDALQVREPVVLGGLSLGGYVALAFSRAHADRLRGLILADTRAEPDTAEGKLNRDKLIAFTEKYTPTDVIDSMLSKMVCDQTRNRKPEVVETIRQIASVQTREGIIGGLRALRDRPDATPELSALRVPTLVIVGAEDVLTPPAMATTLATGIRRAQLVTIEDAGHMANLEQPKEFNQVVRDFLERLQPR